MKKVLFYIVVALLLMGVGGAIAYTVMYENDDKQETVLTENNTTVEALINTDKAYFDNMAGKIVFYESRVVMPKAFNEADKFVAQEVTNVFQQTVPTEKGGVETTVYFFTHQLNSTDVDIDIHKGAFMVEDKAVDIDSLKVTFDQAFTKARQSNYVPSKSCYITLRTPLGPKACNPQYIIGNQSLGQLWVDAVSGEVTDKAPNVNNQ